MGYYEALAHRDKGIESRDIAKKAAKKGLWGSVGRSLGSLAVMGLTAGTVNPLTLGLMTGGGSFLGGYLGAKASGTGDLGKGRVFFKDEGEKLQRELGAFGSGNITAALKSGLTAGIGQKLKLAKDARAAEAAGGTAEEVAKIRKGVGFGESFKESLVGKASQKIARASYPTMEKATLSPMAKKMSSDPSATLKELEGIRNRSLQVGEGLVPSVGDTTGVGTGTLPTGESDIPDLYEMFKEGTQKSFLKSEQSFLFDDPAQGSQLNVSPSEYQWEGYRPSYGKGGGGYKPMRSGFTSVIKGR